MKREATHHTKLKRLQRRLKLPRWQAIGLLESIWHLTANQAPAGDIGRLSNEDIAIGIDYFENENEMIQGLIDSGWLDAHTEHRLLIHDWDQHADDGVNMKLARSKQFFASGRPPKWNRLPTRERIEAYNFYGEKAFTDSSPVRTEPENVRTEPENVRTACARNGDPCEKPEPRQSPAPPEPRQRERESRETPANGANSEKTALSRFSDWIKLWPRVPNAGRAQRAFVSCWNPECDAAMFACRDRFLESKDAADGVIPNPERFLSEQKSAGWGGRWPARPAPQNGAKESLADRTMNVIRERIAKGERPL